MKPKSPRSLKNKLGNINDDRPPGAELVPSALIQKYSQKITSVWWHAKGREDDPIIGVEIGGLRKTFGGYTWNEWWYFMKLVHPAENENEENKCYWYRKRKIPDPDNPNIYKVLEEYIGETLHDPDTGYDLEIPLELQHPESDLCTGPDED